MEGPRRGPRVAPFVSCPHESDGAAARGEAAWCVWAPWAISCTGVMQQSFH